MQLTGHIEQGRGASAVMARLGEAFDDNDFVFKICHGHRRKIPKTDIIDIARLDVPLQETTEYRWKVRAVYLRYDCLQRGW